MDEAALIRRLEAFEAPQAEASRERAMRAVGARPHAARSPAGSRRRFPAARVRLAIALAALGIALAASAVFTPPGQALTSWIGERLGFGDPGGPPTLRELHAFATEGGAAEGQPAYVLVRGPAPGAGHYELITYRMKDEPGKLWPATGARCFELNLPAAPALYGPSCGLPPAVHGVRLDGPAGGSTRDGGYRFFVSGRVSNDIDAVEIEVNGKPVAVELQPIRGELIERFAIRRPFKFFFASLAGAEHGGLLTLTARDASGKAVAERRRGLVGLVGSELLLGALRCREAKRLRAEGEAGARAVRRSCRRAPGD